MMSKIRNVLRYESNMAAFLCGLILSPTLKVVTDCQYNDIFPHCLSTNLYSNTRHTDADKMAVEDSQNVTDYLLSVDCEEVTRFVTNMNAIFPFLKGRLPSDTTCAWTLGEKNDEFAMKQAFVNFTAGITLDISSSAFDLLDIVGSTFLGACFEHCSSKPIWIRNIDGCVRLTPPPETPYNGTFAWGDHVARARERARTLRQAILIQRRRAATRH